MNIHIPTTMYFKIPIFRLFKKMFQHRVACTYQSEVQLGTEDEPEPSFKRWPYGLREASELKTLHGQRTAESVLRLEL